MNLDDRLREAAAALRHSMDGQRVRQAYELLEADYQRRTSSPAALHRLEDEITGLELEETAYKLATQYEQQGRLPEAVHWFLKAAQVDYADSAARLAGILDRLGNREGASYWRAATDDDSPDGDAGSDKAGHTLDCARVQGGADKYLNHQLPAVEAAALREHLLHCRKCLEIFAIRRIASGGRRTDRAKPAAEPGPLPATVTDEVSAQGSVLGGGAAVLTTEHDQSDLGTGRRAGGVCDFVSSGRPPILYQGDGTVVTTAFVESGGYRFPVEELNDLERVETGGLLQSRLFELWAWYRGERICVFRSSDEREFGQVCRALTLARSQAGLG